MKRINIQAVTLVYVCPECQANSKQPLTDLVENGTHTCDCGVDMILADHCEVEGMRTE